MNPQRPWERDESTPEESGGERVDPDRRDSEVAAPGGGSVATPGRLTVTPRVIGGAGNPPGRPAWERPEADDAERPYDPDRPDPVWALEDIDDDRYDAVGRRRIPRWVIVVVILMALALLLQLAWPVIAEFVDRARDDSGFPTPGTI